jgi:hypothetical protein
MTEAEWLAGGDAKAMLVFLRDRATARKKRLFACGCCAGMWAGAPHEAAEHAIRFGERVADRCAVGEEFHLDEVMNAQQRAGAGSDPLTAVRLLYVLSCVLPDPLSLFSQTPPTSFRDKLMEAPRRVIRWFRGTPPAPTDEQRARHTPWLPTIRCVFGNPFRPVAFFPQWHTDTTLALARQMYESREFSAMPILADALQDAGCDNTDILDHCRDVNATHCRGCWVLDLLLDKG